MKIVTFKIKEQSVSSIKIKTAISTLYMLLSKNVQSYFNSYTCAFCTNWHMRRLNRCFDFIEMLLRYVGSFRSARPSLLRVKEKLGKLSRSLETGSCSVTSEKEVK